MHRFQDIKSALQSVDEPNMNTQTFSQTLNDQDMESTFNPKEEADSNLEVIPSSSGRKDKKPHVCTTCYKSFSRKDNLKQHMLIHSGEKSFVCLICEKPFARKSDFNRHKLSHSKVPTQHKCDQCSEVFTRKLDLLKHRKIHKSHKHYNCDQCSEIFSRKADLVEHSKNHSRPTIKHNCDQCSEIFSRKVDLVKHRKNHSKPTIKHNCDQCSEVFSRKCELLKHKKVHKIRKQHSCPNCSSVFHSKSSLLIHMRDFHPHKPKQSDSALKNELYEKVKHFQRQNALNVFSNTIIESNEENDKDFHVFFNSIRSDVLNELNYQMEEKKTIKWRANAKVVVTRVTQEGELETFTPYFHSKTILELIKENIPEHIEDAFAKIINSFEEFIQRGSGWTLEKIVNLEVSSAKI